MRGEFMNGKIKIGLISDIHEDIDALDRYLEYVEKNNIDIVPFHAGFPFIMHIIVNTWVIAIIHSKA